MPTAVVDIARHKIQPLNAINYSVWSKKMQLLLRGKGLWNIVCGKETAPAETQQAEYAKFTHRRDVALTDILLSIEDSCSHTVISLDDPKEVWEKLADMYKTVSDACVDTYLVKLRNLKMKDDEKVMNYFNRLTEIENELATVGYALDESEKRRALLRGLRQEFMVTARVIRAIDMGFTKAVSELVVEEGANEGTLAEDSGSKALASFQKGKGKHYCTHCGRTGHTADRCFHNPSSTYYRKEFTFKTGKGNKRKGKPGSSKNHSRGRDDSSSRDDEVANVALMSKSVLQGEVQLPSSMKQKWFVDSASTSHICNNKENFESLTRQPRRPVEVGEGQLVDVHGIGTVRGTAVVDGKKQTVTMKAVLYVPTMKCNLISVSKTRRSGFKVTFDGDDKDHGFCEVQHKEIGKVVLKGVELSEGLYEAVFQPHPKSRTLLSSTVQQDLWHKRLGHVSPVVMSKTVPIVNGIGLSSVQISPNEKCSDCQVGKSCRSPRPLAEESRKSIGPLDLVHADIVGPMKHPSLSGKKDFIPLYEDHSAVSLVRFLRSRDEASGAIKDMITCLETMRNGRVRQLVVTSYGEDRVKRLRTDNAKELLSRSFKNWLQERGIQHELTSAYSPESNGKAERLNRTLLDMARTILLSAKHLPMHERMWAEAINCASYIRNRLFSRASTNSLQTPYEVLLHKKPNLSHVRIFGSKTYVHIPKAKRKGKLSERANVGYLVGYERGNSYRVYVPTEGKVVISRDVTVDEHSLHSSDDARTKDGSSATGGSVQFEDPFKQFRPMEQPASSNPDDVTQAATVQDDDGIGELDDFQDNQATVQIGDASATVDAGQDDGAAAQYHASSGPHDSLTHYPDIRRSGRQTKPPVRFGFDTAMFIQQTQMQNDDANTPLTFNEAVSGPDSKAWKAAMDEEMQQFKEMNTMKLVDLPEGARIVKNKWVYITKRDAQQRLQRRRARLVAKGFTQKKGVDYDEVFAPVAKYSTVRMMLACAAQDDLEMLLLDVKAAFLNGELEETIFMQQPEGYVIPGKNHMVYQLLKAIYGLKQASRSWRKMINAFLLQLGCTQSKIDSSLYFLVTDGETVYILVYVDDVLMIARVMKVLRLVAKLISDRFVVRIEESVSKFLGIIIEQDSLKKTIKIHSSNLIEQMIFKFGMEKCKPAATPLPEGCTLSVMMRPVDEGEMSLMQRTPYRELVGCILHLANTTRPDIAFAAGYLSRFMSEPGVAHWKAAKHVLRYLSGTKALGIVYGRKDTSSSLHGYSDSDFAGDVDGRKSTSGHCFLFSGGVISWRSKKQSVVAQSTVEAEYIALSFAVREALWLRKFNVKLGFGSTPILVSADNQGALALTTEGVENESSKHIDVKYHFIRDHISCGTVVTKYVPTSEMVADVMIKALGRMKHQLFVRKMGMDF